jgi:hypothetical protein
MAYLCLVTYLLLIMLFLLLSLRMYSSSVKYFYSIYFCILEFFLFFPVSFNLSVCPQLPNILQFLLYFLYISI